MQHAVDEKFDLFDFGDGLYERIYVSFNPGTYQKNPAPERSGERLTIRS